MNYSSHRDTYHEAEDDRNSSRAVEEDNQGPCYYYYLSHTVVAYHEDVGPYVVEVDAAKQDGAGMGVVEVHAVVVVEVNLYCLGICNFPACSPFVPSSDRHCDGVGEKTVVDLQNCACFDALLFFSFSEPSTSGWDSS